MFIIRVSPLHFQSRHLGNFITSGSIKMFSCCLPNKKTILTVLPPVSAKDISGAVLSRDAESASPIVTTLGAEPEEPVINTFVEEKK